MVKRYVNMSIMIVFEIIRQYPSPPDTVIQMICDERLLGPVWTHIEALGRVFGRFCLYMHGIQISYWDTKIQWYRYGIQISYWDIVIRYGIQISYWDTEIQWYRYGIQISYWDTEIQWYRYEIQTVDIQMRYRPLGLVWVHTEALGRVFRRFCPLGTRLCMHRYDEIWWDMR